MQVKAGEENLDLDRVKNLSSDFLGSKAVRFRESVSKLKQFRFENFVRACAGQHCGKHVLLRVVEVLVGLASLFSHDILVNQKFKALSAYQIVPS